MRDYLKFYRLSGATLYDYINTIYQFIKSLLDNKMTIFEEYRAIKKKTNKTIANKKKSGYNILCTKLYIYNHIYPEYFLIRLASIIWIRCCRSRHLRLVCPNTVFDLITALGAQCFKITGKTCDKICIYLYLLRVHFKTRSERTYLMMFMRFLF